jgi:aspartyl-tRNA(Asn)/glutamyl-tRNA(Gln) amidotransferase subunit C
MKLDKQQIQHIANLAKLDLSDEELEKYGGQLSDVLSYIDQLQEVDTNNVEPTAQVTGLVNAWREDEVMEWDEKEIDEALKQAPEIEDRQYKVKRVIQ